jgi:hypothetical protein
VSLGVGLGLDQPTVRGTANNAKNANHARAWPGRQIRGDVAVTCICVFCVICGSLSLLRCDTPTRRRWEKVQAKQRVTGSASENNHGLR